MSVGLWVCFKVRYMGRLLQTEVPHNPASVPGSHLTHQAADELPGNQPVCLGVDEEKWPGATVLVLHMVANPGDPGVRLQLLPLPRHQPQVLPGTEFVGVVHGKVGRPQEEFSRRSGLAIISPLVTKQSWYGEESLGPWTRVEHCSSQLQVVVVRGGELLGQVLVQRGSVIGQTVNHKALKLLLHCRVQNTPGEL